MSTFRLLHRAAPDTLWRILAMLIAATVANIVMLVLLPGSAKLTAAGDQNIRHLILYLVAFALFLYALRMAGGEIIATLREQIAIRRLDLATRLQAADNTVDPTMVKARLDAITRGAAGLPKVALAAQASMAAMLALAYIGVISFAALAIAVSFLIVIGIVFLGRLRDYNAARGRAEARALKDSKGDVSAEASMAQAQQEADLRCFDLNAFSVIIIFALALLMAFVAPLLAQLDQAQTTIVLTAVLFMAGPIALIVDAAPDITDLEAALRDLERLDDEIGVP